MRCHRTPSSARTAPLVTQPYPAAASRFKGNITHSSAIGLTPPPPYPHLASLPGCGSASWTSRSTCIRLLRGPGCDTDLASGASHRRPQSQPNIFIFFLKLNPFECFFPVFFCDVSEFNVPNKRDKKNKTDKARWRTDALPLTLKRAKSGCAIRPQQKYVRPVAGGVAPGSDEGSQCSSLPPSCCCCCCFVCAAILCYALLCNLWGFGILLLAPD